MTNTTNTPAVADLDLPPLPDYTIQFSSVFGSKGEPYFSERRMREYARTAVAAALARSAAPAPATEPGECAAAQNGHRFGAHGPKGEQQCEWCGEATPAVEQSADMAADEKLLGEIEALMHTHALIGVAGDNPLLETRLLNFAGDAIAASRRTAGDASAELVAAADAVIERWHSRDWKQPHTAEFIARLTAAVGAVKFGAAPVSAGQQDSRTAGEPILASGGYWIKPLAAPVAIVDDGDDGLFIDFIYGDNGSPLKMGDKLYLHPDSPAPVSAGEAGKVVMPGKAIFDALAEMRSGVELLLEQSVIKIANLTESAAAPADNAKQEKN